MTHITNDVMNSTVHLEDLVPFLKGAHFKINPTFVRELLINASKCDRPHRNESFANRISCKFNHKCKTALGIRLWISGQRTIPLGKLDKILNMSKYSWEDIEKHLVSIKMGPRRGEAHIRFPIVIGRELGPIVGHILGDGSIDKQYLQPFFSNSDKTLLNEFQDCMFTVFGIKPRIWIQKPRKFEEKSVWLKRVPDIASIPEGHCTGLFYPKICGVVLHAIFGQFALGKDKKITNAILESNSDFKKTLIRAFYDCESTVDVRSYAIRLFQDNKRVLERLRQLLDEQGICSRDIRFYIKRGKKRHYFDITGFGDYSRFDAEIGFSSPNKREKLKELITKVKRNYHFLMKTVR